MRLYQNTPEIAEIHICDDVAASRFLDWIARDDNGEMTDLIWAYCLTPPEMGGLGALPESMDAVTSLHTVIGEHLRTLLAHRYDNDLN